MWSRHDLWRCVHSWRCHLLFQRTVTTRRIWHSWKSFLHPTVLNNVIVFFVLTRYLWIKHNEQYDIKEGPITNFMPKIETSIDAAFWVPRRSTAYLIHGNWHTFPYSHCIPINRFNPSCHTRCQSNIRQTALSERDFSLYGQSPCSGRWKAPLWRGSHEHSHTLGFQRGSRTWTLQCILWRPLALSSSCMIFTGGELHGFILVASISGPFMTAE